MVFWLIGKNSAIISISPDVGLPGTFCRQWGASTPLGSHCSGQTAWASGLGRVWSTAGSWTTTDLHWPPDCSLCLWQACGLALGEVEIGENSTWNHGMISLSLSLCLNSVFLCLFLLLISLSLSFIVYRLFCFFRPWQRFLTQILFPARLTHRILQNVFLPQNRRHLSLYYTWV